MNFFQAGLCLSMILLEAKGNLTTAVMESIVGSVFSIADYFSVNCFYFISADKYPEYQMVRRLTRSVLGNLGKATAFGTLSAYIDFLNRGVQDQCHVPLRMILQMNHDNFNEEFKNFNQMYLKYSEKIHSGVWLIFMSSLEDDFIDASFRNIYMPFDVEVIVACVKGEKVHFKEVYQVAASYPVRQPYFGNWSSREGLSSPKNPSWYFRRTDLEGIKLRVGYVNGNEPFIMKNSLSGYLIDIWRILEGVMNMSSEFNKIDLKRDKDATKNSWLRIMNGILDKKLDVGLGDFVSTSTRVASFDFSYPLFVTNLQLFYRIFENEVLSHTLLLPFENEIWFAVFIWLFFNALTIFWGCRLSRKFSNSQEILIKFRTSIFLSFGGLCGQGSPRVPKSSSCRILFLCIFIVATVLIPSYSASLTRYLTAKPSRVSFRDFRDFYETGTHKMLVVDGSFEFHIFNVTFNKVYKEKIFERYIKNQKLPQSYEEGMKVMCNKQKTAFFALSSNFIWEWNNFENKKLRGDCVLRKMSQNAGIIVIGLIFSKKLRFKKLIDHHLKTLHASGIIERLRFKYWAEHIKALRKLREPVGLQESKGIFLIVIGGVVLAFILIAAEFLMSKKTKKAKERKKRLRRLGFT